MKRRLSRVRSLAFAALLGAAVCGVPALAFGQSALSPAPPDSVELKDGSVLRGTITEVAEGSHVLVRLDGGQMARVRWDVVSRIERAGRPVALGSTPAAPASIASPSPALAAQEMVLVHIDSPDAVRLESMVGKSGRAVCDSPCDVPVPLHGTYRIGGGVRPSRQFTFNAKYGDRVVLSVDPASKGGFVGGIVIMSLGAVSLAAGSLVYLASALVSSVNKDNSGSGGKTVGLVMLGVGVGGLAGGITMMVLNKSSDVDQATAPGAGPPPARDFVAASLPAPFAFPVMFRF